MVGDIRVDTLAGKLLHQFPALFSSGTEALKFVKQLAGRFS